MDPIRDIRDVADRSTPIQDRTIPVDQYEALAKAYWQMEQTHAEALAEMAPACRALYRDHFTLEAF